MNRSLTLIFIFGAGLLVGWHLHKATSPPVSATDPVLANTAPNLYQPINAPAQRPLSNAGTPGLALDGASETISSGEFKRLLSSDFDAAIDAYAYAANHKGTAGLRPVLESWMRQCMSFCDQGEFFNHVNAWLDVFYEDTQVLLILAEYQSRQGYPEEAAKTLQYAATYAYDEAARSAVARALNTLVLATDQRLSKQAAWVALTGFYELLDSIEMTRPEYLLRQALVYGQLGEFDSARTLLLALQAEDQGLNRQWSESLRAALSRTAVTIAPATIATSEPASAIPVTRLGEHYLIELNVGANLPVSLIIDTGASITTLSRESFASMDTRDTVYLGARLFNTAGGVTSGEVYRADSITLGDTTWEQIEFAVLDYPTASGVDGLLGMNVLRNYRFELDQDQLLLFLQPR